ncbi:MAG: peptidoglycan bridge formation glycyltransferase FemA/FemB family protein [Patescibacteria group bacterium]
MLVRHLREQEKKIFNDVVNHPIQSWDWGNFRKKDGLKIERIGFFQKGKIKKAMQVSFKPIPIIGGTAGYLPRGFTPDEDQISALKQLGEKHNAIFIKLEPNALHSDQLNQENLLKKFASDGLVKGKSLFHKHTFQLDLSPSEEKLFAQLKSKTRYNVNLSYKKGVRIQEDSSKQGLETYIGILQETTKRQAFYLHTPGYFRKMWEELKDTGMMRIFHATYQNTVLVSWIMFIFNDVLYYPYGASRSAHKDVMASNLMMWEMIKFGKQEVCKSFDMWGSLGPNVNKKNPWFGFHRFKKGYGGELVEFLGTFDLVINPLNYKLFNISDTLRWKLLRIKTKLNL